MCEIAIIWYFSIHYLFNIIITVMGNISQEAREQYFPISNRVPYIVGNPCYVKSKKDGLELEEFIVTGSQRETSAQAKIYAMRSSSYSHSLVVVFHHFLVNENEKVFLVRLEKSVSRLSQMGQSLSELEGLCIIQSALNGFNELLRHTKAAFPITDHMITLNGKGQIRVWANENFSINTTQNGVTVRSQSIMINQLASAIGKHIRKEDVNKFQTIRASLAQFPTLFQAKIHISSYIGMTDRKNCLLNLLYRFQPISSKKNQVKNDIKYGQGRQNFSFRRMSEDLSEVPVKNLNEQEVEKKNVDKKDEATNPNRRKIFQNKSGLEQTYNLETNRSILDAKNDKKYPNYQKSQVKTTNTANKVQSLKHISDQRHQKGQFGQQMRGKVTFTPNNKERVRSQYQNIQIVPFANQHSFTPKNYEKISNNRADKDLQVIRFHGNNQIRKVQMKKGTKNSTTFQNLQKTPPKGNMIQFNKTQMVTYGQRRGISPPPKDVKSLSPQFRKPLQKQKNQPLINNSGGNPQWNYGKVSHSYEGVTPR